MQKRGQADQMNIMFLIGEIIVGALLVFGLPFFVINSFSNSKEEVMAKDFALTLSTISASPDNFEYRYYPDTEEHTIIVEEESVTVRHKSDAYAKSNFISIKGVDVEPAVINRKKQVPIYMDGYKVTFTEKTKSTPAQTCSRIPNSLGARPKIYLNIENSATSEMKTHLDSMKMKLEALINADGTSSSVELVSYSSGADLIFEIGFENTNNHRFVVYYDSGTELAYQRIACFLSEGMSVDADLLYDDSSKVPFMTQKKVLLYVDGFDYFKDKIKSSADYSDKIVLSTKKYLDEALT